MDIISQVIDEAYEIVNKLSVKSHKDSLSKIKVNTFSDNIVLNLEVNEEFTTYDLLNYFRIICEISKIFTTKYNIFLKGGIELGNYYRDEKFVFGSGLVNAYNAESNAIYPRIIVSNDVVLLLEGKYIENCLEKQRNDFLETVKHLLQLINENAFFSEEIRIEYACLQANLNEKILNIITTLSFSHYDALHESAAKLIVTIKNYEELINKIENNWGNTKFINKLNYDYKNLELALRIYH